MQYTGPTYRPPYEGNSLLLEVTVGCAHNKCTFCTMYRGTKFSIAPMEQIEKDLEEAKRLYGDVKRIFLVNGDAFVLSARRLKPIAEKIIETFPNIETISMYAAVNNIKSKTDEELKELADLRIGDLWVGAETGHAETLIYLNKGNTLDESRTQLLRLNEAGIPFYFGFMFGAAGGPLRFENAEATAKLINETNPKGIVPTTLGAFGNSPLAEDVKKGVFTPATEMEVLEEQKKLIELIDIETYYLGIHGINSISFDAKFPQDQEHSIGRIEHAMKNLDPNYLNSVPVRNSI